MSNIPRATGADNKNNKSAIWVDIMLGRFKAMSNGLHYKFLSLITGLCLLLLCIQLGVDTYNQLHSSRSEKLSQAIDVTHLMARSLEKQFDILELDDIEEILSSVRNREDVVSVSVIDKDVTFYLDGDLITSPLTAVNRSQTQMDALNTAKTTYDFSDNTIKVGEPLLANGSAVGAVMIEYQSPTLMQILMPIIMAKLLSLVPIISIGLILASSLVRQIISPIKNLSSKVSSISEGDLEVEVELEGAEEIQQLGSSFNQMVTTLRSNIAQIYDLAYVDKVTKLPNREFFRKELSKAISFSIRRDTNGALLFLDLDGFKRVNDTFGHDLGDRLLEQFGERITQFVRTTDAVSFSGAGEEIIEEPRLHPVTGEVLEKRAHDLLARLGGDEFTILLSEIRCETDAALVARRIIESISKPFILDGKEITIGASIGIATFPRDGKDYQSIMKHADMAMYQAKNEGKNTVRFFSAALNQQTQDRMEIEIDLRKALKTNELELYYQPKIDVVKRETNSAEALIRWHHPEKGMVNPGEFISVAEDSGLILPLGKYVIEAACKQIVEFAKRGQKISIAVNISMQQFEQDDFCEVVLKALKKTGADPKFLELEITESMAMNNYDTAISHITKLKKLGVKFAIDDFGTGYSNLAQLSRLPFDVFKIDRSFVEALDLETDNECNVIAKTITAMALSLNYKTVAEGVETEEQMKQLVEIGCDLMQGFYFAKPMPVSSYYEWLETDAPVALKDAQKSLSKTPVKKQKKAA